MADEAFSIQGFDTAAFSVNAFAFGFQPAPPPDLGFRPSGGGGGGTSSGQGQPVWRFGERDVRFQAPPAPAPRKPAVRNPIGNFWKK